MKLYIIRDKENVDPNICILVDESKFRDFAQKLRKIDNYIYDDFELYHWGDRDNNAKPEKSRYTLEIQDYDSLSIEDKLQALMYCLNSMY